MIDDSRETPVLRYGLAFLAVSKVADEFKLVKVQTSVEIKGNVGAGNCAKEMNVERMLQSIADT